MSTSKKVEKYISREDRGTSCRFVVTVGKQRRTISFDLDKESSALKIARQVRDELAATRQEPGRPAASSSAFHSSLGSAGFSITSRERTASVALSAPSEIKLADVFAHYRAFEVSKLAGSASALSRLARLETWFGSLQLGQLSYNCIESWKEQRAKGLLGSGRAPGKDRATLPCKHKRHNAKRRGKPLPELVYPVSTQTIRHEIVLLRTSLSKYFEAHSIKSTHGAWLASQYFMYMNLPDAAAPRNQRIPKDHLDLILAKMPELYRPAIKFAHYQGLRREELVSLLWSDMCLESNTFFLRRPAYSGGPTTKSKVKERWVPLTPEAAGLLEEMERKSDKVFPFRGQTIGQVWRKAADAAGFFTYRFHDERREALSTLAEEHGYGAETLVLFSGHADVGTLHKHYIAIDPRKVAKEMQEKHLKRQSKAASALHE